MRLIFNHCRYRDLLWIATYQESKNLKYVIQISFSNINSVKRFSKEWAMDNPLISSRRNSRKLIKKLFLERPSSVTEESFPNFIVFNLVAITVTLNHLGWLLIFSLLGVKTLALFNILSVTMWAFSIYLCRMGKLLSSYTIMAVEIYAHQTLCVMVIGWGAGFQYFILLVPVGLFILPVGHNYYKLLFLLISFGCFALLDFHYRNAAPPFELNFIVLNIINYGNIAFTMGITSVSMFYFSIKIKEASEALNEEHQKSERLLLNILPESIAERLKTGSEIIADRYENVSILFLDIVQFTRMSEKVSAQKLVAFLNKLFTIFDDLTDKYKLEKIKTIGDAYMVAAGIPNPCKDHAERLAKMSIDIKNALKSYNEMNRENVKVRIGINSGSAVAGVIGRKKFAYDIWGDTVNTASRMESYGEPGQIQVSKATYHLLKDKYDFIDRGIINIKGKGDLQTYFLKA
jgi:class 3 adenylate cyclase